VFLEHACRRALARICSQGLLLKCAASVGGGVSQLLRQWKKSFEQQIPVCLAAHPDQIQITVDNGSRKGDT
jgi:hypothetical protein